MKKFCIVLALLFILPTTAFSAPSEAELAKLYVTQNGAGDHSGVNLSNAYSVADFNELSGEYGDYVFYFSGIITSTITPRIHGRSSGYVVLDGYQADNTAFRNFSEHSGRALLNGNGSSSGLIIDGQSYIIVQDFELTDFKGLGLPIIGASHDIIVKRNFFYEMSKAIESYEGSYNITIGGSHGNGNVLKNIGTTTAHADITLLNTHDVIISYNYLYADSPNWGIDGIVVLEPAYDVLVEYNTLHSHNRNDNGEDGIDLKKPNTYNFIIRYNHIYDFTLQTCITVQSGSHDVYIYGNRLSSSENGIITGDNPSNDNVYIFSNLIYDMEEKSISIGSQGSAGHVYIFGNTIAEGGWCTDGGDGCRSANSTTGWGNVWINNADQAVLKNNILYKGRPHANNYQNLYLGTRMDTSTTSDYNQYDWPGQTTEIYWGDAGANDLSEIQGGSGNGLPQERHGDEGDPGLVDIDYKNFRVASSSSAVVDNGETLGTGNIAVLNIQGVDYQVRWGEALSPETDWGQSPPAVVAANQNEYGAGWERGAYVYGDGGDPPDDDDNDGDVTSGPTVVHAEVDSTGKRCTVTFSTPVTGYAKGGMNLDGSSAGDDIEIGVSGPISGYKNEIEYVIWGQVDSKDTIDLDYDGSGTICDADGNRLQAIENLPVTNSSTN